MKFFVKQIAELLNGIVEGDAMAEIWELSKIEEGKKGSITFLANPKYTHYIYSTEATAVIVSKEFTSSSSLTCSLIRVQDPYAAFTTLLEFGQKVKLDSKVGLEQPCFVSEEVEKNEGLYVGAFSYISKGAKIGKNVKIFPQVFIGESCEIGDNTVLYSGVKINDFCKVGSRCVIHSNVVIGSDGFGFAPQNDGSFKKIPQTGNVIVEDDVEIGACSTIDRATMGSTVISKGVKLDNQTQVAHNVHIGKNTVIAAQSGIAGSSKIGENCMIGGQVGIVGHLKIQDRVMIGAQAGVTKNLPSDTSWQGSPAIDYKNYFKSYLHFKQLPELIKKITK